MLIRRLAFNGVLEHSEATTFYFSGLLREKYPLYQYTHSPAAFYQTSSIYNPLYYLYLRAFPEAWIANLSALRILSFVPPFLLSAVLVEASIRRILGLNWAGLLWSLLFLALYPMYAWIDLSRPDAIFMLSIISVLFTCSLKDSGFLKFILVGLSICVCFLVKQTGLLLIGIPLVMAVYERKYLISFAAALGSIILSVALLQWTYGPAYWHWAFTIPRTDPYSLNQSILLVAQYTGDVVISLLAPFLLLSQKHLPNNRTLRDIAPLLLTCGAAFGLAFVSGGKCGGWIADFVIYMEISAIVLAILLREALRSLHMNILLSGLAVSLGVLFSISILEARNMRHNLKPARNETDQIELVQMVHHIKGDVWTTTWPIIDYLAGKTIKSPLQIICQAWFGVCNTPSNIRADYLDPKIWNPITEKHVEAVFMPDNLSVPTLEAILKQKYIYCLSLKNHLKIKYFYGGQMFWPSEVWVASQTTCDDLRATFGYAAQPAQN
ncbi:hypothetical protein [Acetobacter fabarum]|nr:hypothetical protein [Acetobacter fabarum]